MKKKIGQDVVSLTLEILVRIKIQQNARRPYFTTDEIYEYEKELGIGIFCEENYKCHHCGVARHDSYLILCSGCNRAWVCSEECHVDGWSNHKEICKNKWRQQGLPFVAQFNDMLNETIVEKEGVFVAKEGRGKYCVICIDPKSSSEADNDNSNSGLCFDAWSDRNITVGESIEGYTPGYIERNNRLMKLITGEIDFTPINK